ncbi:MAG: M20/M25/M40 family metallo-hydrolase [Planctomycetes bacterium]|nr:M20/M25/M40 family metallo-hydrolase [Planctomycetota bacterium]
MMHFRPISLFLLATALAAQAPTTAVSAPAERPIPAGAPAAMALIRAQQLQAHAEFLASDALGGRLTGSPGQRKAAEYVARHFESLGLEPFGDEGKAGEARSWFQSYPILRTRLDAEHTRIEVAGQRFADGFSVLPARKPEDVQVKGKLRFLGVNRVPSDAGNDSLAGAIPVVVLRGSGLPNASVEQEFGVAFSQLTRIQGVASRLEKRGARLVVFAILDDHGAIANVLNYMGVHPGKDLVAPGKPLAEVLAMPDMGAMAQAYAGKTPKVFTSARVSRALLEAMGLSEQGLAAAGDEPAQPPKAKDATASVGVAVRKEEAQAVNVVGVLRGGDPKLAKEAVVYSAHMDHVGTRMDGEVFNGADDNASGTSGLLEIATAFAKAEARPRRSIVFLSVSGEELGLWGSAWYAEHPTWEASAMIANINTDMIGRSGPESGADEVTVTPSYAHGAFSTIVRDAARFARELGMGLTSGDKYYTRSDHFNFVQKGIPAVFFCNGEHEDYHKVSDHADKLDAQKMERIARLAFWTGWAVAGADARPQTLGRQTGWDGNTPRAGKGEKPRGGKKE